MRCYFNLANTDEMTADQEGIEVANQEQAYAVALATIAEMVRDGEAQASDWRGWRLIAVDESGALLFTVSLGAVST